jgi:hypothetical protein
MLPTLSLDKVWATMDVRADSDDAPVRDHTFDAAALARFRRPEWGPPGSPQMLLLAEADWRPGNTVDRAGVTNQQGVHFP